MQIFLLFKHFVLNRCSKYVRLFIFLVLTLSFSATIYAQSLQWAKSFYGSGSSFNGSFAGYNHGNTITTDNKGNIYTSGSSSGNIFISKVDPQGHFKWVKNIGGVNNDFATSVAVDNNGNVYTTGYFSFPGVDFDPGPAIYSLSPSVNHAIFISKLDSNGNFVWAKKIDTQDYDLANSLVVDQNANLYITGKYSGSADFSAGAGTGYLTAPTSQDATFILKLNANGSFIWAKSIGAAGGASYGNSIQVDSIGNVYTAGKFTGTGSYGLSSLGGNPGVFFLKLNSVGNFVWSKTIGSANNTIVVNSMKIDKSGDVLSTGYFSGTMDFDPGSGVDTLFSSSQNAFILKLDANGNFTWVKNMGTIFCQSINTDISKNIYTTGYFSYTHDFDPDSGVYNMTSFGTNLDIFISELDVNGNFITASMAGSFYDDYGTDIVSDANGNIYSTGFFTGNVDFDPSVDTVILSNPNSYSKDIFITKFKIKGVYGYIYNDINQNCIKGTNEISLVGRKALINPGNIIVETGYDGSWYVDSLPSGNYSITYDTSGNWIPTCPTTINFTVIGSNNITSVPSFGLKSTQPCAEPDVSITAPLLRKCLSQNIYVQANNSIIATGGLNNVYVDVKLDSLLIVNGASLTYTTLGNNQFRFQLDTLNPGQSICFIINATVNCLSTIGQTLCIEAHLFPIDSCVFTPSISDTSSTQSCGSTWDHSNLSVTGLCQNDSIYFSITNNGNGNMLCYSPLRIYIDSILTYSDSIMLISGQTTIYSYAGNGHTWLLQVDQHPLHPGNSHPTAYIEACDSISNWTPDLINNFPLDDIDPIVDMYCGIVSGSFDPNEKTGFPQGIGIQHDILPNQQLQYLIRFQNTGTDTAFKIVIRDTLDAKLDIFSVLPGVASNPYSFRMYGPRVLEWTFNNILLPDSTTNEPYSHGFATFTVNQNPNLPNGTIILNKADIYFDLNTPVITNKTLHTINNQSNNYSGLTNTINKSLFKIFPNPGDDILNIEIFYNGKQDLNEEFLIEIKNMLGQAVYRIKSKQSRNSLDINKLPNGLYLVSIESKESKQCIKFIKN